LTNIIPGFLEFINVISELLSTIFALIDVTFRKI